jgi:hypothetical protein
MQESLTRIDPPLPFITPKGRGDAHFVKDMGIERHAIWYIFLRENGECWAFENPHIRMENNFTLGRQCKTALHAESHSQPHQSQSQFPQSHSQ